MSWLRQKLSAVKHGFFEKMQAVTPQQDRPDWGNFDFKAYSQRFDDYSRRYPKVKSCLITISGQVVADGVYTSVTEDYPRAQEAKRICDEFNKRIGMYQLIRKTAYRMAKYGTAFWELDWNDAIGLSARCVPHQEYMRPKINALTHELDGWEYVTFQDVKVSFSKNQIACFAFDPEEFEPFGTSLLTGIDYELSTQDQIRKNLLAYLEKQAFASNVLQVGDGAYTPSDDAIASINSEIKNRKVGEDFVTSYPIELKVMGAAQVETRMIPDTLKFTDDQVTDALMSPPISKLYNSTEASATVMTDWARACLITPIQNIIREVVEKQVYQPMLENMGYTVKLTPQLSFDPPDVHTNDEATYWATLVDKQIQSPEQVCKALGLEYDGAYFKAKEEKAIVQQQMQLDAKQIEVDQQEKKPTEEPIKEYVITEYPARRKHL